MKKEEEGFCYRRKHIFDEDHSVYNNLITEEKKHTEKRTICKWKKTYEKRENERKRGRRISVHRQIFVCKFKLHLLKHVNQRRNEQLRQINQRTHRKL